ncbi:sulfatase [Catenovulum maritimum]|uniref:Acetylglucosamine-6-sulfatase n=1 Tax=Catenovulum maritimum TaxID=1513271 RepID=A0A0J8GR59_9ALTE|nr:sulfatase [Catenovulum maritimum]KMT63689.1 acetylglucosamine-6-sulfatase [Catenovulum maritimum]
MKRLLKKITTHAPLAGGPARFRPGIVISAISLLSLISACSFLGTTDLNNRGQYDTKPSIEQATVEKKPNILFLLADDHRWDLIGKIHPIIKTPNLDELANKGTFFSKAFVTTPICAASRASIVTGLTERTHDYTFLRPEVSPEDTAITYPKLLKEHGYKSAFIGKYGMALSGDLSAHFDYIKRLPISKTGVHNGKTIPQTYYMAELAKDFIEQNKNTDKPWTMSISFRNPHAHDRDKKDQYHYPAELESLYQDVTIPPAKFSSDEDFAALPDFLKKSIARERWHYRFGSEDIYQRMAKRHYRAITAVDSAVGMIYEKLKETGMAENTIIIYTGDNGYSMNERQLAGKWFGWDEDLQVPLIIFDPRQPKAQVREEVALNIDIAPTILDMAGVEIPKRYQGKSLTKIVAGGTEQWRNEFFFEHMYHSKRADIPPTVGVRTDEWKYIRFYKNNYEQLYHLKKDPQESINLATSASHQRVLNTLRQKTNDYIDQYEAQRSDTVKKRGIDGVKGTDYISKGSKNF